MSENGNQNTFTRLEDKWFKLSDIPVHGDTLTGKSNNIIRFFFENVDGFVVRGKKKNRCNKNKHKQCYLNNLLSSLEIDIFGGSETLQKLDLLPHWKSLHKQMVLREEERFQTSHNVHDQSSESQQGGTCMMSSEEVAQNVTTHGVDEEGLCRWS